MGKAVLLALVAACGSSATSITPPVSGGAVRLTLPKGTAVAVPDSQVTLKFVGSGWASPINGGHIGFVEIEAADGARTEKLHVSQDDWTKLHDTFGVRWRLTGKIIDGAEFPTTIDAETL